MMQEKMERNIKLIYGQVDTDVHINDQRQTDKEWKMMQMMEGMTGMRLTTTKGDE